MTTLLTTTIQIDIDAKNNNKDVNNDNNGANNDNQDAKNDDNAKNDEDAYHNEGNVRLLTIQKTR